MIDRFGQIEDGFDSKKAGLNKEPGLAAREELSQTSRSGKHAGGVVAEGICRIRISITDEHAVAHKHAVADEYAIADEYALTVNKRRRAAAHGV